MKQIRFFIQVLEKVLFNKQEGKKEKAMQLIYEALGKLPESNEADFSTLPLTDTRKAVEQNGHLNTELAFCLKKLNFWKIIPPEKPGSRHFCFTGKP